MNWLEWITISAILSILFSFLLAITTGTFSILSGILVYAIVILAGRALGDWDA